jgi:hypothetical protein
MAFEFPLFFQICARMDEKEFDYADFVSEERIVPEEKLGKYNLPFILFPAFFPFLFVINFGTQGFLIGVDNFFSFQNLFLIFSAGFVVHELLHFLSWQAFSGLPIQDFRLGMRWSQFTPVIGCQRPMRPFAFRIGLIMPFLLMGVLPMSFAFYFQNAWLLCSAVIYMAWASADILTFILFWKAPSNSFVEMHRTALGCIVYNPKPNLDKSSASIKIQVD